MNQHHVAHSSRFIAPHRRVGADCGGPLVTVAPVEIEPSRIRLRGKSGHSVIDFDPEHTDRVLFSLRRPARTGSIGLTISFVRA